MEGISEEDWNALPRKVRRKMKKLVKKGDRNKLDLKVSEQIRAKHTPVHSLDIAETLTGQGYCAWCMNNIHRKCKGKIHGTSDPCKCKENNHLGVPDTLLADLQKETRG